MIRIAHRRYQNNIIKQLAINNKDRLYYKLIDEISDVGNGRSKQIPPIITPEIAIKDSDINWDQITSDLYTKIPRDS